MRIVTTVAVLTVLALSVGSASAGNGHWICTADGIKTWTSSLDTKDATGWSYSGDRTAYKDAGHCAKG